MKALALTLITAISINAVAADSYHCAGKDEKGKKAEIEVSFENAKKVIVVDMEGTDIDLPFVKAGAKGRVYEDDTYDGYGGFVRLTVPSNIAIGGSKPSPSFKADYRQDVYSEIGHVATVKFTGVCELQAR